MKKQIATTAAAMAVTALMAFQPMTAFAATANCENGANSRGCTIQVCQSYGCNTAGNRVTSGISRKNLSGKNCSSQQMISYVMGNSFCRR